MSDAGLLSCRPGNSATREEALAAEPQIKGWSRKKKEAMMRGDWKSVSQLAKKKFSKKKQACYSNVDLTTSRVETYSEGSPRAWLRGVFLRA